MMIKLQIALSAPPPVEVVSPAVTKTWQEQAKEIDKYEALKDLKETLIQNHKRNS